MFQHLKLIVQLKLPTFNMITCSWKLSAQHSTYTTTCQFNNQHSTWETKTNFAISVFSAQRYIQVSSSYQTRWVVNNCRAIKVHRCEFLTSLWGQRKMSAKMYHMSNADVTSQPQGLFPVSGLPWSLLTHNQDSGFSCHCGKDNF